MHAPIDRASDAPPAPSASTETGSNDLAARETTVPASFVIVGSGGNPFFVNPPGTE